MTDNIKTIEYADGSREWYFNGKLHREGGPAIEYSNGSREWYSNDRLHRDDGPAIERSNGSKEWYWKDVIDQRGYQFGFGRDANGATYYIAGCHIWPSLPVALDHYGASYRSNGDRDQCIRLLHEVAARIAAQV